MPRSVVGMLAAVGTAMSVFAGSAHSDVVLVIVSVVTGCCERLGCLSYLSLPQKKVLDF
jgi:hypothetical protein